MDKCIACGKSFANGDVVLTYFLEKVMAGEKSGLLGYYEHVSFTEQYVERLHFTYGCIEKAFSPVDNPFLFDIVAESIRREIYEEEREKDEFDLPMVIEEEPPFCLWCKREDTVWMHQRRDVHIYNCLACSKLWDHDEDEMYWDPQKADYVYVEY